MCASASSRSCRTRCEAVGTPAAAMTSLAKAFDPSMWAAAALGPNALMPASKHVSTSPFTSGTSGPTTTRSHFCSCASATSPLMSSAATSKHATLSPAMPALPGAAITCGDCGLRSNARTSACSRPPEPTTRTFFKSERRDEVVDRNRRQRLVAAGSATAELHRHPRDRLLVRRLQHVDEVEAAERRPLRLDRRTELLHLPVYLADSSRVVLDRLDPLRGEGREQDVGRHAAHRTLAECATTLSFNRGSSMRWAWCLGSRS